MGVSAGKIAIDSRSQRQRTEDTTRKLKAAAYDLLMESGVSGLTMSALAERARLSPALMRYHFESKSKFVQLLLAEAIATAGNMFRDSRSEAPSAIGTLRVMLNRQVAFFRTEPVLAAAYLNLISDCNHKQEPSLLEMVRRHNNAVRGLLVDVIRSGFRDGSIDASVNPDAAATVFLGSIRGILQQWMVDPEGVDLEGAFHALKTGWIKALAG